MPGKLIGSSNLDVSRDFCVQKIALKQEIYNYPLTKTENLSVSFLKKCITSDVYSRRSQLWRLFL